MKNAIIALILLPGITIFGCNTPLSDAERRAIAKTVSMTADSMMHAWAAKDRHSFLSYHTDEFTFVIEGKLMDAGEAKKLLPGLLSRYEGLTVDFSWEHSAASVFTPDLALFFGKFHIVKTDTAGKQSEESGAMSIIFKRIDHHWLADHIHESIPNK